MATEAETKEIYDRLRAVENAMIRMEAVPKQLDAILTALAEEREENKKLYREKAEEDGKKAEKVALLAESIREIAHDDRTCRASNDQKFAGILANMKDGAAHFESLEKKCRENADDLAEYKRKVAETYIEKAAPGKMRDGAMKWVALAMGFIGLLSALGIYSNGQTKALTRTVKENSVMEIVQTNGRTFMIRGSQP